MCLVVLGVIVGYLSQIGRGLDRPRDPKQWKRGDWGKRSPSFLFRNTSRPAGPTLKTDGGPCPPIDSALPNTPSLLIVLHVHHTAYNDDNDPSNDGNRLLLVLQAPGPLPPGGLPPPVPRALHSPLRRCALLHRRQQRQQRLRHQQPLHLAPLLPLRPRNLQKVSLSKQRPGRPWRSEHGLYRRARQSHVPSNPQQLPRTLNTEPRQRVGLRRLPTPDDAQYL